jgi:3-oxoacyl-[acyl-carrier-protein] synthase-3
MRSLSVNFPKTVRDNDYYRRRFPDVVAAEEQKTLARLFSAERANQPTDDPFLAEMAKYVADPFRGTVERRVLGPGETALDIELPAARRALELAGLEPDQVGAIICSSFLPDQLGVGNAVPLAKALGTKRPAWNLEATCASSIVAFQTACALVQAGHHENVLVVISCTYSRVGDDADSLSWFTGDAAAAFVVGRVPDDEGFLGAGTQSTTETCGTFYYEFSPTDERPDRIVMRCTPETGRRIHETSLPHLKGCCEDAVARAGLTLEDVDFFVVNTPSAFFSAFVARALGIDPERTLTTYPKYANVGGALMPVNLCEAATTGRIRPGDVVLLYGFGGVGAASAVVMRWGEVAIG